MTESSLIYFTHVVDGARYGAWYRTISSTQLEVLGLGILESGEYAGFSPENAAKSILENFVRLRIRMGAPIPSLETLEHQYGVDEEPIAQPESTSQPTRRIDRPA